MNFSNYGYDNVRNTVSAGNYSKWSRENLHSKSYSNEATLSKEKLQVECASNEKFSPFEWDQTNIRHYNEAENEKMESEKIRAEAARIIREAKERSAWGQSDTNVRLTERLSEIHRWKRELEEERQRVLYEIHCLENAAEAVSRSRKDCDPPLRVGRECLYHREGRTGIDLVKDCAEEALLKEMALLKECKERLENAKVAVLEHTREMKKTAMQLESDIKSKESAEHIDSVCSFLNNNSASISRYSGVDSYGQSKSNPEMWAENTSKLLRKSEKQRKRALELRGECDKVANDCAASLWNAWNDSNAALARRVVEISEAKDKLHMHLHKIQGEIYQGEKTVENLEKTLREKMAPLKVAETRMELRNRRREVELCEDRVNERLRKEIKDLREDAARLKDKLKGSEQQLNKLRGVRATLISDIETKANSLFIDREKCLGIRKMCPVSTFPNR